MNSIAVVGIGCRYPDARTPEELWQNVLAQRRAFRRIPSVRLRVEDYRDDGRNRVDSIYTSWAAVIEGYEFDRARFRVAGPAYRAADLAHWLALDVAAGALADAGFAAGEGLPRDTTGVVLGNTLTGEFSRAHSLRLRWPYVRRVVDESLREHGWPAAERAEWLQRLESRYKAPFSEPGEETLAGGLSNTIAGRICNHFDLKGGGYTVDGACASSLLAVTTACTSLTVGDLDVAIAGGVDLSLDPFELVGFARTGALAPELMRVYDARSAGFWPGEGCGFLVLMREDDARARGLQIKALIRGWGVASDGSGGITRPEAKGQILALRRAYGRAGYGADSVGYFEGHGTGTSVGDAVELDVLSSARREAAPDAAIAAVGSVKANIGHTKAAAGVAGLIKAILAIEHQVLPPTTGCFEPHPSLEQAAVRVLSEAEPWPDAAPLRASVSAMGFGGIDTHVTIESAAPERRSGLSADEQTMAATPQDAELFLFGAADVAGLSAQIERVRAYAAQLSLAELTDVAAALARNLPAVKPAVRAAAVASTPAELEQRLAALLEQADDRSGARAGAPLDARAGAPLDARAGAPLDARAGARLDARAGVFFGTVTRPARVAFLFPGQGSPTHRDGGLWRRRFAFARARYREARLEQYGDPKSTAAAQPAIVTASLVALRSLAELGITAHAAVGHSLGELTAWHWAGALDGAALLRLASVRGRAMADLPGPTGTMASLAIDARGAEPLIAGSGVVIAGFNHPRQTVISGEAHAIRGVLERARAAGIASVPLRVSHAFHSPLVAATAPALEAHVAREPFGAVEGTVFSTIAGERLNASSDLGALLRDQLTSPVRFIDAIRGASEGVDLWLEVGPGQTLCGLVGEQSNIPAIALDAGSGSVRGWLEAAGAAWALGVPLRHAALHEGRFVRPFDLDWRPRFFANPCELAPVGDESFVVRDADEMPAATSTVTVDANATALDIVRRLVAERVELPVEAVHDDHRLLGDLHLNSIVVGQLAIESSKRLGLAPPTDPTAYAGSTVRELAQALESLVATRGDGPVAAPMGPPAGIDAWVRPFAVRWVKRERRGRVSAAEPGGWRVFAAAGDPLAAAIEGELARRDLGSGVVVCLPPEPDERQIELLLEATRALWPHRATGRFVVVQRGGGGAGFARSLHLESPETATCVVDVPAGDPRAPGWVVGEALAAAGFVESRIDNDGVRWEPVLAPVTERRLDPLPLDASDVLLVTGGGKGIASECALALARERGVKLGLVGRSQVTRDSTLADNLERMARHGIQLHYVAADVCDAAALKRAIVEIEAKLGPVTAVLHGAGANQPRPLSALDAAEFRRTVEPKLDGARNVMASLDPTRLKLFVAIGSIIARTGLRGEADYAAANEWLAGWVRRFQEAHPRCRCRVVEWSVWSGVGMGERLGRVEALEREGIAAIPPDVGVQSLLEAIDSVADEPAVVVAGRFGTPPTVTLEERGLPLMRFLERPRVHYPGIELIADSDVSRDSDPYVEDHLFEGERLVPAVLGLEAMAQAAVALTGREGRVTFEDVRFTRPIVAPAEGTETLRVAALARPDGTVDVALRCGSTGFVVDHFRARCRIDAAAADPGVHIALEGEAMLDGPIAIEPGRDLYGSVLFQSGRFQRLSGYRWLRATECLAEIEADGAKPWFGSFLPVRLVLGDPGGRDAAIHAVQACIPHRVLLPVGVERIECACLPSAKPLVVRARERSREGDTFVYDVTVAEAEGGMVERWTGLTLRAVSPTRPPETWAEPLLATYLERRFGELVPASGLRVAAHKAAVGVDTAHAVQVALSRPARVQHRPDGKPEVAGANGVSASHSDAMVLAVTGAGVVGCDVEPVAELAADRWRELLGAERTRLAESVAVAAGESSDAASTRTWAALECLKKAGLPIKTPLGLGRVTDDGWVLLTAGSATVATFVARRRGTGPVAIALLSGTA